jgi:hypothetical protein
MFDHMGKGLVLAGALMMVLGALFIFGPKVPFLGKLPGDIYIQRENFQFYFPLTTCIIVSILVWLVIRIFR